MTDVVAALIFDGDKFMICQRPKNKTRGLMWEFPGGKAEKGETYADALKRECLEELDASISVGDLFCEVIHEYADITVRLLVYSCRLNGSYTKLEHNDIRFILPSQCGEYDFCPADEPVIKKLQNMKGSE